MAKLSSKEKKTIKKILSNKNIVIALVSIILIIGIVFGVIYFAFPKTFWSMFGGDQNEISNPEGHLAVHFLDVGQGDATIVQLPDGKNMIIDAGGSNGSNHSESAGKDVSAKDIITDKIDELGITEFEHMILTHSDADHVDFMDTVLSKYVVNNIYRPAFRSESEVSTEANKEFAIVTTDTYDNFVVAANKEVSESGAKIHYNIGDFDITGTGYHIDMQCVDEKYYTIAEVGTGTGISGFEKNFVSPVTVLTYGNVDERIIVFTGDAEGAEGNGSEEVYLNTYRPKYDADVLKAGHHGSESSSSQELLNAIDPEHVVISAGVKNTHKHPRAEMIDRLSAYKDVKADGDTNGIKSYSTRDHGDISLAINIEGEMTWTTRFDVSKPVTPGPIKDAKSANIFTTILAANSREQLGLCA